MESVNIKLHSMYKHSFGIVFISPQEIPKVARVRTHTHV
jgi:hypothetical protein